MLAGVSPVQPPVYSPPAYSPGAAGAAPPPGYQQAQPGYYQPQQGYHPQQAAAAINLQQVFIHTDPMELTKDGNTYFHDVCQKGDKNELQHILENSRKPNPNFKPFNINVTNKEKKTGLHLACMEGREAIAKLLIQNGANVNALDGNDHTPLTDASWKGFGDIVELLLTNGAKEKINQRTSKYCEGYTALMWASAFSDDLKTAQLLIQHGAQVDIQSKTQNQYTAVHLAAEANHCLILGELLKARPDLVDCSSPGTPLYCAASKAHLKAVEILLAAKASPHASPYALGDVYYNITDHENLNEVALALIKAGAKVNQLCYEGNTPLHCAFHGYSTYRFDPRGPEWGRGMPDNHTKFNPEAVRVLLKLPKGTINHTIRNSKGETAFEMFAKFTANFDENTVLEFTQLFIESGAFFTSDIYNTWFGEPVKTQNYKRLKAYVDARYDGGCCVVS